MNVAAVAMSPRGEWAIYADGKMDVAPSTAALVRNLEERGTVRAVCRQKRALESLAVWTVRATMAAGLALPSVGLRPTSGGRGARLEVGHVGRGGVRAGWSISCGATMLDGADADAIAPCVEEPSGRDELRDCAEGTAAVVDAWQSCVADLGLRPRLSAGSTAAQLLPRKWRKAAMALGQDPTWHELRDAYYGGRVECRRPGWSGRATEYDLRSAYGAAVAGKWGFLPDWKLYEREPRSREPGWYLATVRATAGAPLPRRRVDARGRAAGLEWPEDGSTWSAWFCLPELEDPEVEIVAIHRAFAGRYSDDLQASAQALLSRRDASTDRTERAVIRLLLVALAGKLAQRRVDWRVWVPARGQEPPETAIVLGDPKRGIVVYPSRTDAPSPYYMPHVAAYITTLPRVELRRELRRAGAAALYCDTDSIHVEEGTPPPIDCGPGFGQWAEKASGDAWYQSARHYRVGDKIVQVDTSPRWR